LRYFNFRFAHFERNLNGGFYEADFRFQTQQKCHKSALWELTIFL